MRDQPEPLMTFPSLDQAESALDWIGVAFADGDGCFEGELAADDAELIDVVLADPETPEPVRELATALRALLAAAGDAAAGDAAAGDAAAGDDDAAMAWRVAFNG